MGVSSESFAICFEKVITGRRSKTKRMAANPSTTTTAKVTYSPIDPTRKTRPPIFSGSDVDWLRPDSRGFHQCRPACKLTLFSILLISVFFFLGFLLKKKLSLFELYIGQNRNLCDVWSGFECWSFFPPLLMFLIILKKIASLGCSLSACILACLFSLYEILIWLPWSLLLSC